MPFALKLLSNTWDSAVWFQNHKHTVLLKCFVFHTFFEKWISKVNIQSVCHIVNYLFRNYWVDQNCTFWYRSLGRLRLQGHEYGLQLKIGSSCASFGIGFINNANIDGSCLNRIKFLSKNIAFYVKLTAGWYLECGDSVFLDTENNYSEFLNDIFKLENLRFTIPKMSYFLNKLAFGTHWYLNSSRD